jgi:hypothetical protein
VAAEEGNSVLLEEALILIDHAVQPRQKLLGTVVGMQDDGDAIDRGDGSHIVGGGDRTGDGSLLVSIGETLAREEGCTALRDLDNNRRVCLLGGFKNGDAVM